MIKYIFILPIKAYQLLISPFLGNRCRFNPSCSHYALGCFQIFPFYKAMWYSVIRILKCHPFHGGGEDPLPKR